MHSKFNLSAIENDFSRLDKSTGENLFSSSKNSVIQGIKRYSDSQGVLQADKIIDDWFPLIEANVFISHSHKDESIAKGLAGFLHNEFRLNSFIDSTVWGYADDLLRCVDNNYCWSEGSNTYIYERRNFSTAHIHMMLSSSLLNMMDKCECVIFLNTENSYKISTEMGEIGKTGSPWIFHELSALKTLRRNRTGRENRVANEMHDSVMRMEKIESFNRLNVDYQVDISDLADLSYLDLLDWKNSYHGYSDSKKPHALDALYKLISRKEVFYG